MPEHGFCSSRVARLLFWPFCFFFAVLSLASSHAQTDSTIKIATPAWRNITNSDGTGLYFDILRAVYEPAGIEMQFRIVPWKRALYMVESHSADALPGAYYLADRHVRFPRYPIGSEVMGVVCPKGRLEKWDGQQSLAGKTIAWMRGYNYHKFLDVEVVAHEIDHQDQGWKLVDAGRVDFYMENVNILNNAIQRMKIDMGSYDLHIVLENPLFLRFADSVRAEKLIAHYDERMAHLVENGTIRGLFERWGFPYPAAVFNPAPGQRNEGRQPAK